MNVYYIRFPNKKLYVGVESNSGQRKYAHSRSKNNNSKTLVSKAIRKYGWENCHFAYLTENQDDEFCYEFEIFIIKTLKLQNIEYGYNQSSGGERGFKGVKMSKQHRDKIGNAHRGKKKSLESSLKRSILLRGRKLSKSHKIAISKGLEGKNINRFKGHTHSEKSKKKSSDSSKGEKNHFFGKNHSDLSKKKMSESQKIRFAKTPAWNKGLKKLLGESHNG